MDSQPKHISSTNKNAQDTPIEKLQQHDQRSDQSTTPPSVAQQTHEHDYVVDRQIAEMSAGHLPPPTASDPAAPGVQDLAVGGTAWLAQAVHSLQIYAQPGTSSSIAMIDAGERVSVIEGPQEQDGTSWVRVRTAEGQEGWVKSGDLGSE